MQGAASGTGSHPGGSTSGTRPGPGPSEFVCKVEGSSSSSRAGRVRDVKLIAGWLSLAVAGFLFKARALVSTGIMVTYRDNAGFTLAGFAT